jgi:hypothetical protein
VKVIDKFFLSFSTRFEAALYSNVMGLVSSVFTDNKNIMVQFFAGKHTQAHSRFSVIYGVH